MKRKNIHKSKSAQKSSRLKFQKFFWEEAAKENALLHILGDEVMLDPDKGKEAFEKGLTHDAPLNCFLILALEAALQMGAWLGHEPDRAFEDATRSLRAAVADAFWDGETSAFRTHAHSETLTELTQALAEAFHIAVAEYDGGLVEWQPLLVDADFSLGLVLTHCVLTTLYGWMSENKKIVAYYILKTHK